MTVSKISPDLQKNISFKNTKKAHPAVDKNTVQKQSKTSLYAAGGIGLLALSGIIYAVATKHKIPKTASVQEPVNEIVVDLEKYLKSLKDKTAVIFQKNKPANLKADAEKFNENGTVLIQKNGIVCLFRKDGSIASERKYDSYGRLYEYNLFNKKGDAVRQWEKSSQGEFLETTKFTGKNGNYTKKLITPDSTLDFKALFDENGNYIGEKYVRIKNGQKEINNLINSENYYSDYTKRSDGTFFLFKKFKKDGKSFRIVREYKGKKAYTVSDSTVENNVVIENIRRKNLKTGKVSENIIKQTCGENKKPLLIELCTKDGTLIESRELIYDKPLSYTEAKVVKYISKKPNGETKTVDAVSNHKYDFDLRTRLSNFGA